MRSTPVLAAAFLSSLATLLGCDALTSKAKATLGDDASAAEAKATPTTARDEADYVACELLPGSIVAQAFPELAGVTFADSDTLRDLDGIAKGKAPKAARPARPEHRRETVRVGLGSVCSYSWPKPDAAEIRARNEAKSQEVVAKALSKQKGGLAGGLMAALSDMESDRASVSVAVLGKKPAASAPAARKSYDERLATLRRGLKGKDISTADVDAGRAVAEALKGLEVPPDGTLADVAGIGDAAAWSAKSRTLHVLRGRHVFNVSVDAREDQNRAKAEAVANAIVRGL